MERDLYFDNLKGILILFVVFGHLIEPYIDGNYYVYLVYTFIYVFHMPAFIFVSGYFSRSFIKSHNKKDRILKILKLFLFFQIFSSFFYVYVTGTSVFSVGMLYTANWTLWYLLSLVYWQLILMWAVKIKHPMIIAVIGAVLIGYFDRIPFGIPRTIAFLPFFLSGYYFDKAYIDKFKSNKAKAFSVFGLFAVIAILAALNLNPRWFWGSISYSKLGHTEWYVGIFRIGIMAMQVAGVIFVLILTPSFKGWLAKIGEKTLPIYLAHPYIVSLIRLM